MLKSNISSQITLNELFVRLINLHEDLYNHDICEFEREAILKASSVINKSPILNAIGKVSSYAYHFTVLNIAKALTWKVSNKPIYYKVYEADEDYAFKVYKKNQILTCDCYFASSMKLPCEHIIACLIHSTDTESHKSYLNNILLLYHERWHENDNVFNADEEDKLCSFIKQYHFEKKVNSSQQSDLENNDEKEISKEIPGNIQNNQDEEQKENNPFDETDEVLKPIENLDQEAIESEKITRKKVLNPNDAKTVGRPPDVKRYPFFFEKKLSARKRKPSGELQNDGLKKVKKFITLFSQ